ncbi:MAG: tetratricopeptide repeat protein [Spirochaetia bacterium]|nr:tetratricopeptide repeat protein [Spirochaetia bacterium]
MQKKIINILLIFLINFEITEAKLEKEEYDIIKKEGLEYYHRKRFENALEIFEDLIEEDPENSEAFFYYDEILALTIECEIWLERAVDLMNQARYNQAIESVNKAEEIYPYHPDIDSIRDNILDMINSSKPFKHLSAEEQDIFYNTLKLGWDNLEKGKNEEAINLFAKCLTLAPKSPEAIEGYNEAQKRFKEKLYREKLENMFVKASNFENQKRYPQAVSVYDEILRIDPGNSEALENRQRLSDYIKNQQEKAQQLQLAKELLESGQKHIAEKRFIEGIEQFELAKSALPDYTNWDKLISDAERQKKQYEEKTFEAQLKEISKNFEEGLFLLATEKFKQAISSFEKVITISEQYDQMSETKKQAEDLLKKAQENLQRQEEEEVSTESPYYKLVKSLEALGEKEYQKKNYNTAQKYFSGILELFPKNKNAYLYFILCSIKLNPQIKDKVINDLIIQIENSLVTDPASARRIIDIALQIDPNHPKIKSYAEKKPKKETIIAKPKVPAETLEKWYKEALSMVRTNQNKALELARKIVNADPTHSKARNLLTRLEGRISSSKETIVKEIDPKAKKAYTQGIVFYNSGKITEAIESFTYALKIEPDFIKAKNALSKCKAYLK